MQNIIYVNYLSRFANNIFQYALAHIIQDLVGGEIFFSPLSVIRSGQSHDRPLEAVPIQEIPLYQITDSKNILDRGDWSGKFREEEKAALRKTGVYFAEDVLEFDDEKLVVSAAYRAHPERPIIVSGYYQDYRYYRGRKENVRALLQGLDRFPLQRLPGERDIVLNFRGTDLSWAQMPLSFYRWVLDKEHFEKLWIVTEDPGHRTVVRLLESYPGEVLSNGAIPDLKFVMSARKIIMTVSTFCWMAAWLSNAGKIYFPLGSPFPLFDRHGDQCLVVRDDPRYVYVKPFFDNSFWRRLLPLYFECASSSLVPSPPKS